MKVNFILRGSGELKTIYIRVRNGREIDVKMSLGINVSEKDWDLKSSMPKLLISSSIEAEKLHKKLSDILYSVNDFASSKGRNLEIDKKWLKFATEHNSLQKSKDQLLEDCIETYKDELKYRFQNGKKEVAPGTIRNYNTTIQRLKKYEDYFGCRLTLKDISFEFHQNYIKFAKDLLQLSINSIGRDIKNIKCVCIAARDSGHDVNQNVFSKRFHAPREKTTFVTLNIQEILKLEEFSGAEYLENARDWLIIACWTACRCKDLMSLNKENLVKYKGKTIIKYLQSKTGKIVMLAIHPQVQKVLDTRGGNFPRPISQKNFNEYIKEVCRKIGIDKLEQGLAIDPVLKRKVHGTYPKYLLVQSHIGRRSFASNHYGKISTTKIMAATAHSTERMLLCYIGEVEENHIDDFLDVWRA